MKQKPLLTIGMIFKNEIRCLERCLKALRPLRDAIPCELVMADTGSDDGSREIAAKYADILFDFPWIDDFSAARNAVIDRALGKWYLTVDADEYLDPDVSELVGFLLHGDERCSAGSVIQRNYTGWQMDGSYNDFTALRLLKLSAGLRYHGAIHESFGPEAGEHIQLFVRPLFKTVLHHDGYAGLSGKGGQAKRERNIRLLRRELEKSPDNLRRLQEYLESGMEEPDYLDMIRRAARLIEEKRPHWDLYGPPIFRLAVAAAVQRELPETEAWVRRAEAWFPDSYFTRIDVAALAFSVCWNHGGDYSGCIRWGEMYCAACGEYDRDRKKEFALAVGAVAKASPADQANMRIFLSAAYLKAHRPEKALNLMSSVDFTLMDQQMTEILTWNLLDLHAHSLLDTAPLALAVWEGIAIPKPHQERADERRAVFYQNAAPAFSLSYRDKEAFQGDLLRPAYTALLPLEGRCTLGTAAAILETKTPQKLTGLLRRVECWNELPAAAVAHAAQCGVPFPLPDRPMQLEEMDELAARLAQEPEVWKPLLEQAMAAHFVQSLQSLFWARALVLAGVQRGEWRDAEAGMRLARQFAELEAALLPRCYTPEVLTPEGLDILPPWHRFGWYCAQAFAALDSGNAAEYARALRHGLKACKGAKAMVEFLLEHTAELQAPRPSPELLALAEQVRTMLAACAPNDPAVAALKASPVYREVAYLIEGAGT